MKEQIQLKDFLGFHFLSNMQSDPTYQRFAYIESTCDEENNTYQSFLHVVTKDKDIQLTSNGDEHLYLWDDEETILFANMRDKQDQAAVNQGEERSVFYRISVQGGESKKAFTIPLQVTDIQKLKEHTYIVTANYDLRYSHAYAACEKSKKTIAEAKAEDKDFEVFDELPFYFNGQGYTHTKRKTLFLFEEEEGKLTRITSTYDQVASCVCNSEHTKLYITKETYEHRPSMKDGLFVYDVATGQLEELLASNQYGIYDIAYVDDCLLLACNDEQTYGLNQNPKFYRFDITTHDLTKIHDFDQALGNTVGSDCRYGSDHFSMVYQNTYYFIATIGYQSVLYALQTDGTLTTVFTQKGSIDGFCYIDDTLYCYGMFDHSLQEIYQYKEELSQQSNYHDDYKKQKDIRIPQYVGITNDNTSLDGWVLLPRNYDATQQYPAILDIHGGPKTVYGEVYYHEMQVWANLGYFVFFMNPRGSDGKGNAFADIRGKYGTIDFDDIMAFTDEIIATYPQIDTARIGVTGGSYGGFMTNWIITHTKRFAAAASQRSIANWISFTATSDIGEAFGKDQQQADIWENQEKLWWHSPLKYAHQCVTPTLFIHSDEDYRCPYSEGIQMYSALHMHGVKTRLCMFKKENHELSRSGKPKHRVKRLQEITNWMNQHLQIHTQKIFVYGTLRTGMYNYDQYIKDYLVQSELAYVKGSLYEVAGKPYPALTPGNDMIAGEIIELKHHHIDAILDELEGFKREHDVTNLYDKVRSTIYDDCGQVIADLPVYFFHHTGKEHELGNKIKENDYVTYLYKKQQIN